MKTVFFIDDEENVLKSLKRAFRNENFKGYYFTNGEEALNEVIKLKPQVIVSDILMPQMTGFELLKRAKELSPASVGVILSGYADVTTILHAMNSGEIYRFITKPWKIEDTARKIIEESINYSEYLSSSISD